MPVRWSPRYMIVTLRSSGTLLEQLTRTPDFEKSRIVTRNPPGFPSTFRIAGAAELSRTWRRRCSTFHHYERSGGCRSGLQFLISVFERGQKISMTRHIQRLKEFFRDLVRMVPVENRNPVSIGQQARAFHHRSQRHRNFEFEGRRLAEPCCLLHGGWKIPKRD